MGISGGKAIVQENVGDADIGVGVVVRPLPE
jgi:hypothetical protein